MKNRRFALDYFIKQRSNAGTYDVATCRSIMLDVFETAFETDTGTAELFANLFIKYAHRRYCTTYSTIPITDGERIFPSAWGVVLPCEDAGNPIPDEFAQREFERIFTALCLQFANIPEAHTAFIAAKEFTGGATKSTNTNISSTTGTATNAQKERFSPTGETPNARINGLQENTQTSENTSTGTQTTEDYGSQDAIRTEAENIFGKRSIIERFLNLFECVLDYDYYYY